jgi:4-diphosphocytidyl-2-C-methyl-D-erythritol kinase
VLSKASIGRGTGTEIEPIANDLAGTPVLLVNPRIPLATGPVFKGWDGIDRGPMPSGTPRTIALEGRNDLEPSAIALVPRIADVIAALADSGAWLARMSGSGATCFALYESTKARDAAADALPPEWWRLAGDIR